MMQDAQRTSEETSSLIAPPGDWCRLHHGDSRHMDAIPDNSCALVFTSPPYNVGKAYTDNLFLADYMQLLEDVFAQCYQKLIHGGRMVVNIANVGRKPYVPLTSYVHGTLRSLGLIGMAEIIWEKGKTGGGCAWGSWASAKSPVMRDAHEYLLVYAKGSPSRPDKGESTIGRDEFLLATSSIWRIAPASAKCIGHPAPFPVALAERVISLYSYAGDVVMDPFMGSGTVALAAQNHNRLFAGFDQEIAYVELATKRLAQAQAEKINPKVKKRK